MSNPGEARLGQSAPQSESGAEDDCSLVEEQLQPPVQFVKQEVEEDAQAAELGADPVSAQVSEQLAFNLAESQSRSLTNPTASSASMPPLSSASMPLEGLSTSSMGNPYYSCAPSFLSNFPGITSSGSPFVFRQQKVRRDLSLTDKVRLIQRYDTSHKSQRALAAEFDISVGSVNNILRRKKEYLDAYNGISSSETDMVPKIFRKTQNPMKGHLTEINAYVLKWVETARAKKMSVTSSAVQERGRDFARRIRLNNFIAPATWLEGLRAHYSLQISPDADQSADAGSRLTLPWSKMLPFLIQGYDPENIFTCGEMTLFYNALPDKCLMDGGACMGSHHVVNIEDHRVTILLGCSAAGEKLSPFIVCHSDQGASLTSEDVPLGFRPSPDAFMTPAIFADWLRHLDSIMEQQNRRIALFMEMSPPHLGGLVLKNINLKFFLDGSAQHLQPLNLGIFTMFRAHYRKRFLQSILAKVQDCDDIPGLLSSVGLIDALHWIKSAWDRVKPATVVSCFESVGFPAELPDDNAPDMIPPTLMELVEETGQMLKFTPMSTQIYVQFDSQMACFNLDMADWERQLLVDHLARLGRIFGDHDCKDNLPASRRGRLSVDSDQGSGDPGTIPSQTEALVCLDRLKQFARTDSQLLDTLYSAEELLLDHITYRRRMARFQGGQLPHFVPAQPRLLPQPTQGEGSSSQPTRPGGMVLQTHAQGFTMVTTAASNVRSHRGEVHAAASNPGIRAHKAEIPTPTIPGTQVYRAEAAHLPLADVE